MKTYYVFGIHDLSINKIIFVGYTTASLNKRLADLIDNAFKSTYANQSPIVKYIATKNVNDFKIILFDTIVTDDFQDVIDSVNRHIASYGTNDLYNTKRFGFSRTEKKQMLDLHFNKRIPPTKLNEYIDTDRHVAMRIVKSITDSQMKEYISTMKTEPPWIIKMQ